MEIKKIERCEDPTCKGYLQPCVDRGYGYPVCPTNKGSLHPVPMNPKYEGTYLKEEAQ